MRLVLRLAGPEDLDALLRGDRGLFDHPVDAACSAAFPSDPRHHLAPALRRTYAAAGRVEAETAFVMFDFKLGGEA
ncbi:hypothetical protein LDO26_05045 [Luteimonas sp. BDR2-5]|uniref:hypothetical protein n=1 Tax=Proluteimonas luteida TaxID=2878685 RepID=UPI001E523943|nr:hypothetical protein [Luteimonas sp. BDR2-5]MCD9027578.1 hypothetical protein [Luteimonas sp. BDR2-5]